MHSKLFSNKKGQVVDIVGGIQRGVSWLLTTAPKPLLYLLFLLFLVGFAAIFSFLLNTTGNFCDTAGNEYRTGSFTLLTNFQLITSMPNAEELDSEVLDAGDVDFDDRGFTKCSNYFSSANGGWVYLDAAKVEQSLPVGYYLFDSGCVVCSQTVDAIPPSGSAFSTDICLDNVIYPKEREDMSFIERNTCGKFLGRCAIPLGYYYNRTDNTYVCDDDLCRNDEGELNTRGELWNLKLKEKGAVIQEPSIYGDRDYRNALNVECDAGDLNPKLRFFGINVFDYKLWVLLFLLTAVIWLLFKLKK